MKNIHKDALVKKIWKLIISILYYSFWFFSIGRVFLQMRDTAQQTHGNWQDYFGWSSLLVFTFYILMYLVYWAKPVWFREKLNKVQNVEVCDATDAE